MNPFERRLPGEPDSAPLPGAHLPQQPVRYLPFRFCNQYGFSNLETGSRFPLGTLMVENVAKSSSGFNKPILLWRGAHLSARQISAFPEIAHF
jgi:hypothetical protein